MALTDIWSELRQVKQEKRRELVLVDAKCKTRKPSISDPAVQIALANQCTTLNFLEISRLDLQILSPVLCSKLINLTKLVLHSNSLQELPDEIASLTKLNFLDLSRNQLSRLPASIGSLTAVNHLNCSENRLTNEGVPDLSELVNLFEVNFASNELTEVPDSLIPNKSKIFSLNLSNNRILAIPEAIADLEFLKSLDLSNNSIQVVPSRLVECAKLKDLSLVNNPLKDRRLGKLIADIHHAKVSVIFEYLRKCADREASVDSENATKGKAKEKAKRKKEKKKAGKMEDDENDDNAVKDAVHVLARKAENAVILLSDSMHYRKFTSFEGSSFQLKVIRCASVEEIRPHIACCIVKNVKLEVDGHFKKFLNIQNKMHDDETVCKHRIAATIATHDLSKITGPLKFTVRPATQLIITPLGSSEPITAEYLIAKLVEEAEAIRKKEKRSNFTGVYKYLNLVKGHDKFTCLEDANEKIVSFAPVTNSECTKMTRDTVDLLLEVSSPESQATCRRVMDRLIYEMLNLNLAGEPEDEHKSLHLEQVRVVSEQGELRIAYPDRTDLNNGDIDVIRKNEDDAA